MIPLLALATVFMGTVSLVSSLFDSSGRLQHRVAVAWGRMLLKICRVRVDVIGAERLDPNVDYVFVSNHFSLIDTPLMFASMPREFRILARRNLWKIPFLGWHLGRAGHIPVMRENPRAATSVYPVAAEKVRSGYSLLIFPEGGRARDDGMRRFKLGAAYIGVEAQRPIVPMAIVGTRRILPPGSSNLTPGRAELRIGDPIPTGGLGRKDAKVLMGRVRDEVARIWRAPSWS